MWHSWHHSSLTRPYKSFSDKNPPARSHPRSFHVDSILNFNITYSRQKKACNNWCRKISRCFKGISCISTGAGFPTSNQLAWCNLYNYIIYLNISCRTLRHPTRQAQFYAAHQSSALLLSSLQQNEGRCNQTAFKFKCGAFKSGCIKILRFYSLPSEIMADVHSWAQVHIQPMERKLIFPTTLMSCQFW